MPEYRSVASLRSPAELREYAARLGCEVPVDDQVLTGIDAPLSRPYGLRDGFIVGNRFCAQPMEGWDGTADGKPTELTLRRWRNFGRSGAKLIWGGEAVAVMHEGRSNPRQLLASRENAAELTRLRRALVEAHTAEFGESGDLLVGLQLTHSGRFSRPNRQDLPEPRILCHHPVLDRKLGLPADYPVLTDAEILDVIDRFVEAAEIARDAGFDFVDIKHCHGYLGHEFLSAFDRPGAFGGSLENRTQFLREVVERIRPRVKDLRIGVRVSAFDTVPFGRGPDGRGVPEVCESPYRGFGVNPSDPTQPDLEETGSLLAILGELGVCLVNLTAGSPYYSPHLTRPARYAAPYGYLPPEDPLVGVVRHIAVVRHLKQRFPLLTVVGSAYTYLQEWLGHVAQPLVRSGAVDFVGLGRMMLSYPEMPAELLAGRPLTRKRICRTFGQCSIAGRMGLPAGCYPLDGCYRDRPESEMVRRASREYER